MDERDYKALNESVQNKPNSEKEIIIKITIPESEFNGWEEYPNNMNFVLSSLKRDFISACIRMGIENMNIETRLD